MRKGNQEEKRQGREEGKEKRVYARLTTPG